jgi:peptidyl-prolyl cis-trans isomerase C
VKNWLAILIAGAALTCADGDPDLGMSPEEMERNPDRVALAVVGSERFTVTDILSSISRVGPLAEERFQAPQARLEFVESFVNFEVLTREAVARGLHRAPGPTRALKAALAQALWEKGQLPGADRADLTEERLREFHRRRAGEFLEPERALVSQILVKLPAGRPLEARASAKKKAQAIRAKLGTSVDAAAFAAAARRYSEDETTKGEGGALGLLSRGVVDERVPAEVVEGAFALRPGQVSGLLESSQGVHILRVESRLPARPASFDAVRKQVEARLWREMRRRAMRRLIETLEKGAKVEVDAAQARALGETSRWLR